MKKRTSRLLLAIAIAAWCGAATAALGAVSLHAAKPGEGSSAPARWPSETRIDKRARPAMLVFAHSQCPCTRATLHELERLLVRIGDRADVWVIVSGPTGGDVREAARSIPGVHVVDDDGRVETRRFGARTSGVVLLYAADGALLFTGGITPSRGHEGTSLGAARLEQLLAENVAGPRTNASVFGCALFERPSE